MGIARAFLLAAALAFSACAGPGRTAAWETIPSGAVATSTASSPKTKLAEAAFLRRDDKLELERAIALFREATTEEPHDVAAMVGLARSYAFLAELHLMIEESSAEARLLAAEQSMGWAERAMMAADPRFAAKVQAGVDLAEAVETLEAPALDGAYWYTVGALRFARAKGLRARLYYRDRLRAVYERLHALSPDHFHGGPDRFLGVYYAGFALQGTADLGRSEEAFHRSLAAAPDFLLTKVLEADALAVARDDGALYRKLLTEVAQANPGSDPDTAPENRAAQRLAAKMLKGADARF
ncbi:MAG: TRAP transporter TatT component family protein [Myxococcota bacterium]